MIAFLSLALGAPTVLDDEAFRFCHENGDHEFEERFCPLLEHVPEDRCPGMRAFCAAPDEAPARGCDRPTPSKGTTGNDPVAPEAPTHEWDLDAPSGCDTQQSSLGLTTLLGWIFAIVVAVIVAGIALALLRYLGLRADAPVPTVVRVKKVEEEEQSFAEAVQDVPDLPSDDLLGAARRALDEGRLGEAAVLARGSVLRRLGERRVLKLHRARTDREYLGQSGEHRGPLGEVFEVAEQHRWGRVPLDAPRVRTALEAAARLLAAVALLLWGFAAHGANERYGPAGDVGLERVLRKHGFEVSFRLRGLEGLDENGADLDVLVLDTTGLDPTPEDWASIRRWVELGHVLWVAGAPEGFPELGSREAVSGEVALYGPLAGEGLETPIWPNGPLLGFTGGEGWVVSEGANPIVVAPVGAGVVLAVADPVLLWNGSLVVPANEAFLGEVLVRGQARGWPMGEPAIVQLATIAGSRGDQNPATSVMNLRLLPFVIQVLVLWIAIVAWRGWPFAPLADPPSRGRRNFAEHLDALARRYRQDRGSRHVAHAYASLVLERYRRSGLVLLARRHGLSAKEADALADRAVALSENPEGPSGRSDFELMEDLWKVTRPR
ncbi:MAG: hypothetical protein R3F61_11480 [Myxococcota bacterium]